MPNPAPLLLCNGISEGQLTCFLPKVLVGYSVWPSNVKDLSQVFVDEDLYFVVRDFGTSPGLCSIEKTVFTFDFNSLS